MVRLFFLNSFRSILFSLKFCDKVLLTQKYPMNPGKQVKKKKIIYRHKDERPLCQRFLTVIGRARWA